MALRNWIPILLLGSLGLFLRIKLALLNQTKLFSTTLPWGTLAANTLGSFLIGLLFPLLQQKPSPSSLTLGIIAGFLGCLTTFSSYTLELFLLIKENPLKSLLYFLLTQSLTLTSLALGLLAYKKIYL